MKTPQINKNNYNGDPFLLSGSKIINGKGLALVCLIGNNSMISNIK